MGIHDQWQRISHVVAIAAGALSGTPLLRAASAPTAGRSIHVAAMQWEPQAFVTQYCDGSLGAGYPWTGTVHA